MTQDQTNAVYDHFCEDGKMDKELFNKAVNEILSMPFHKSAPIVANMCIVNALRLPDELLVNVVAKLSQHLEEKQST